MRLNPPTVFVFAISLVLIALAIVSRLGVAGLVLPEYMPHQEFWLAVFAYLILMLGNLIRGL
jgi:hypothetical protein